MIIIGSVKTNRSLRLFYSASFRSFSIFCLSIRKQASSQNESFKFHLIPC